MRAILLILTSAALSGCANPGVARRTACDPSDVPKPTLLRRLGLGRALGEKRPETSPVGVEPAPQADPTVVRPAPGAGVTSD